PYPAPPRVPLLGRWLTHYAERARVPGSCLLLPMTGLLTRHWTTGQSHLEDQHLGALLAWIRGEDPTHAELARDARGQLLVPPAGPATDPAFDNRLLAPAMARYDAGVPGAEKEIADLLHTVLHPTWDAVWTGLDLLRELPEAPRAAARWRGDRWSYTGHRDRVRAGEPPQPRRDDAVTAARKLASRERAQAELDAQEALDDPLVMAGRRLTGEAFAGEVTDVVMAYSEGKRPRPRPLLTFRTADTPHAAAGTRVYRDTESGKPQTAEVVSYEPGDPATDTPAELTLRLTDRMGRGKDPDPGSIPDPGERLCFTLFEHSPRGGPGLPDPEDTPWTHGGPPGSLTAESADPPTAEDFL
ncbi:hypothetical protein G5C51_30545, partial [Streptomyces sp. A7024]